MIPYTGGSIATTPPIPTPQLQINELYRRRVSKDTARLKTYNEILQRIYHRIRIISQMPNSPANITYTVPQFILGLPRIDLEDCIVYLVHQLRMNMFAVRYTFPNLLSISWEHHEKDYITGQSPIMLAMLEADDVAKERLKRQQAFMQKSKKHQSHATATAMATGTNMSGQFGQTGGMMPAPSARQKKSVRFAPSTAQQNIPYPQMKTPLQSMYADPMAPSVGQTPSASEYIPPSNFLRTMTVPQSQHSHSQTQIGKPPMLSASTPTSATSALMNLWGGR